MPTDTPDDVSAEGTTASPGAGAGRRDRECHGGDTGDQGKVARDAPAGDSRAPALRPLQVISSVLAAGLGVQSSRNRERDFRQGRAVTFIVAGLVFTALFIGGVYTVVSLVLAGR
jgi:hypothetical protein